MAAAGIIVLLAIAASVAVLSFDINSYKPKIEAAASDAAGLDVRIGGKMGLSLFPFGVSARDVRVTGRTGAVLSSEELRIGVELLPLLRREIAVSGCRLVKPSLTIEKDYAGKYNFEGGRKSPGKKGRGSAFSIKIITLSKGTLLYYDRKTKGKVELKDMDLTIRDLFIGDTSGDILKGISFSGKMECKTARRKTLVVNNVSASITAEKGVFRIPVSMDIFGGKGRGDVIMDMSRPLALYKIDFSVPKLDFARLAEAYSSKKTLGGKGNLSASVTMRGKNPLSTMDGTFSLRGDNLVIYTMDLDKVLSQFEGSQKFNLVDLGAFFVAGPLGAAATGGYRLGEVYTQAGGGEGRIRKLVSDWKIRNGVAAATDCAFATKSHRVALKGRLDLAGERYDDVIVAHIDGKGCAKFSQQISGPFGSPRTGAVSTAQTLLGPILNLFGRAKGMVDGGRCEVFYNGSVRP